MPPRPLPTGFAEALGSVQRVRAAKRAQQREATPPEALSGADTEKASEKGSERQRDDRKQEQQSRQAERERQRQPEQNWARLVREGEKEAERRRQKQADLQRSRWRDKEAAAAAQAQARRQAEEEAVASRRRELEELQADVEKFKRRAEDAEKQRLAEVEARRRDKEAAAAAQAQARRQAEEEAVASRRRELEELQADVEKFKRRAEDAEKQRLAEVEARRRDKEAAAAAQAEARRQEELLAEEEAAADAASDELDPGSPSACAPLAVNAQAHKEQSPIDEALSKLEDLHRRREQSHIDEALSKLAELRTKKEAAPRERRPGLANRDLLLELGPRTAGAAECLEELSEEGGEDQEEASEDHPEEGAASDVLEGLDNLSDVSYAGSEHASYPCATEGHAKTKADIGGALSKLAQERSNREANKRAARDSQASDITLYQSPTVEALSKLAEQHKKREAQALAVKRAASERFDRDRPPSPSRELYLDTLVESEDTAGRGNNLIHNRLVPLQPPETIRCALASVYMLASTYAQKL